MKKIILVGLVSLTSWVQLSSAQTTSFSDVVGYETKALPANTYTSVGINLLHPDLLVAPVTSTTSSSLNVSGSSNVGALLNSAEPYYVEVKSGNAQGARLDVDVAATIAAANGSVVVNTSSVNNTDALAAIAADLSGATVALRKHVTLSDIGNSITGLTSGATGTGDEILLLDASTGGFITYLRRSSTTWRDANNNTVNSLPVPPGIGIIINKRAVPGSITSSGSVRANNFAINTVAGYQLVTLGFPLDRSPNDIGADDTANGWTSGVSGDAFLLLNNSGGFDKYLFRTSTSWRDANNNTVTTNKFLNSGNSYVLFRNASGGYDLTKPSF